MRRLVVAGLVGALVLMGGACGNDDDGDDGLDAEPATTTEADDTDAQDELDTTSTTTTTTEADDTTTSTTAASDGTDALTFFQRTEGECIAHSDDVGNTPPEPERYAGATALGPAPGSGDTWLIEDGMGDQLVVDLDEMVVHSPDGPDQPLPPMYSFGCPPDLFPGTMTH